MKSPEFKLSSESSLKEGNKEMRDNGEPDYTKITASDLRRVLRGEESKAENELAVFTKYRPSDPDVFAFWNKRFHTDTELSRIKYSDEAQAHFQALLNPEEDQWDSDLKSPTGMPMHRSDPDATYRGPYR